MEKFNKSMIGRKVRFINAKAHELEPDYYPAVGTIGTIAPITGYFDTPWGVCWPKGSVYDCGVESNRNTWFCDEKSIELVEEVTEHMTDKDIFQMFIPKLKKNYPDICWEHYWVHDHLIHAIALAYRSGYGRGKKGRPFKIGGDANC